MAKDETIGNRLIIILFAAGIVALGSNDLLKRHSGVKGWLQRDRTSDILAELQADPSGRTSQGMPVADARKEGHARYDGWAATEAEKENNNEDKRQSGLLDRLLHAVAP